MNLNVMSSTAFISGCILILTSCTSSAVATDRSGDWLRSTNGLDSAFEEFERFPIDSDNHVENKADGEGRDIEDSDDIPHHDHRTPGRLEDLMEPIPERQNKCRFFKNLIFGPDYPHYFDLINEFLVENVHIDDGKVNIEVAEEQLKLMLKRKIGIKSALTKAFEHFVSLSELNNPNVRCTARGFSILQKVDKGTPGKDYNGRNKESRRIEEIFFEYAEKHLRSCMKNYLEIWSQKKVYLNPEVRKSLEVLVIEMTREEQTTDDIPLSEVLSPAAVEFLVEADKILGSKNEQSVLRAIRRQLEDDTELTPRILKTAFKRYLLQPCDIYLRELGQFFRDFDQHVKLLHDRSIDVGFDIDEAKQDFYLGWAKFHMCELLIKKNERLLKNLLDRITNN